MKLNYRLEYWKAECNNEWYWHVKAKNGRIVADSGEGYKRSSTMLKTMENLFPGVFAILIENPHA